MAVKVVEPEGADCHWTVGVGVPEAAAVKVAVWPCLTVWDVGSVVTVGGEFTVNVAGLVTAVVVVDPTVLVKTASYFMPFMVVVVAGVV
jgi:hypothetical protein